jgi:hypothetical protein
MEREFGVSIIAFLCFALLCCIVPVLEERAEVARQKVELVAGGKINCWVALQGIHGDVGVDSWGYFYSELRQNIKVASVVQNLRDRAYEELSTSEVVSVEPKVEIPDFRRTLLKIILELTEQCVDMPNVNHLRNEAVYLIEVSIGPLSNFLRIFYRGLSLE